MTVDAAFRTRTPRRSTLTEPAGAVRLLEEDPDLGHRLSDRDRQVASRFLLADARSLERGRWCIQDDPAVDAAHFGLLVLDGVLVRRAEVGRRAALELLGSGDVLCPDLTDDEGAAVTQEGNWYVLRRTRVAVLSEDLIGGAAGLRSIIAELNRRTLRRSRALALRLALVGEPDLDTRLELLLWHLADRWGRREAGCTVLLLPLNRELLAALACAHPSATGRALRRLHENRRVARRADGALALLADAPTALRAA